MESSLAERCELADVPGDTGDTGDTSDSATMDIRRHDQVKRRMTDDGGTVTPSLLG